MKRLPLVINIILFSLVCVLLSYWGLQIFKPTIRPMQAPIIVDSFEPNVGQWGNLFGTPARTESAPSSYQLKGVIVAPRASDSVAIIVIEGKPNFTIGVGKELMAGVSLKEVHSDHVIVSESGISRRIELPVPAPHAGIVSTQANDPLNFRSQGVVPPLSPPLSPVAPVGR
ncbi:type II secretion system protein N [Undibacterium sp. Ji22W]|jgi:general secretion pathway protein C|uniref:type II secretion system protein N n=1 Tax=Undibacterium sp. Ji22W TaxID=3413038 RepID=UPI003BF3AD27